MPISLGELKAVNQKNLKKLDNGGRIAFLQKGKFIAIGDGHKPEVMAELQDGDHGQIVITKGSALSAGTLEVHGSHARHEFETHIAEFSKKKVVFK